MTPFDILEWIMIYIMGLMAFAFTFLIVLGAVFLVKAGKKNERSH